MLNKKHVFGGGLYFSNTTNIATSTKTINKFSIFLALSLLAPTTVHAGKTINKYLNEADVSFDVQHSQGGLTLVGKEKGATKFSYTISNFNNFQDYTGDNFTAMRLGNEIRWRYMDPYEHFYEIAVNSNGDMEMLETNQTNTGTKTFAFKTDGTLKNHGSQAFFKLYLSANQFHNYGTIQMWNYHFFHNYSFNSGVLKSGEIPTGIADLRSPEMKLSTARPYYKQNVIENYGKVISSNKLNINDGLSYTERNESVFKDLEMTGGDIKVTGNMNVSGQLSGAIRNVMLVDKSAFYLENFTGYLTGKYKCHDNAFLYTSSENLKKLAKEQEDLDDEVQELAHLQDDVQYSRYFSLKNGIRPFDITEYELQCYKSRCGKHWKTAAAKKTAIGLQGGGIVGAALVTSAFGYGLAKATGGSARTSMSSDGHVTLTVGNSAGHMRDVEQTANQIYQQQQAQQNNALNSPYQNYMFPRQLRNRTRLDNAIQCLYPRKVQAEERRYRYLPVSDYRHYVHRNKLSPLTQIYNAYNLKGDTSEYLVNRSNCHRLYSSLRDAEISHRDILTVVGNPYIGVVKRWRDLPLVMKQRILQEHPEMPELSTFLERTKAEFKAVTPAYKSLNLHEQRIVDEGIEDLSFWFIPALPAKIPAGLKVAYATFKAKVPQIANAYSAKPEFVRNIVNFFKKKANDGLKKGAESAEKRTIPMHDKQREFIEKKVNSGEWKKMKGRFMFEDEKGRRFAPTKEKFEFEVGEKRNGKWEHIGILRGEGNGAGEILRGKFAKGKSYGHYFE